MYDVRVNSEGDLQYVRLSRTVVAKYHRLKGTQPAWISKVSNTPVVEEVRGRRQLGGRIGSLHPIINAS